MYAKLIYKIYYTTILLIYYFTFSQMIIWTLYVQMYVMVCCIVFCNFAFIVPVRNVHDTCTMYIVHIQNYNQYVKIISII